MGTLASTTGDKVDGWIVVEPPCWGASDLSVLNELVPDPPERRRDALALPNDLQESLGIELWRAVANVRLWAETPPARRAELFSRVNRRDLQRDAVRQHAAELATALDIFEELTAAPHLVRSRDLVDGCKVIVAWAEARALYETAIQFSEAAAATAPGRPSLANLAARQCRLAGQHGRAELWYERAIGLARQVLRAAPAGPRRKALRREYIYAHLGFSTVLLERDEIGKALKAIKRAGLSAKAAGMKGPAAEAFHDALYLSIVNGTFARGVVYARKAVGLYPFHHERYPALGNDFALLMLCVGMYAPALSIAQSAARKIETPAEQLVAWGTVARAAGGVGLRKRFLEAESKIHNVGTKYREASPAAFFSLGEGARLLGDWDEAERYGRTALELARAVGSQQIVRMSEELLTATAERRKGVPELAVSDARGTVLRRLAPVVRLRLARWRGPTWRPRPLENPDREFDQ